MYKLAIIFYIEQSKDGNVNLVCPLPRMSLHQIKPYWLLLLQVSVQRGNFLEYPTRASSII